MAISYAGIGHIGLRVQDMKQAEQWYTQALGLPVVCRVPMDTGEGDRIVFLKLPTGQHIELIRDEGTFHGMTVKGQQSHWHCCLEMDARHEAYRDLARRGIPFTRNPEDRVAFDGSWAAFIHDPEGNEWELMEFSPISKQIIHLPDNMNPKE